MSSMREKMEAMVRKAQDEVCEAVSKLDGTEFREDNWERPGGRRHKPRDSRRQRF
jgi:coproporphyrinogen III oxidase